MIVRSRINMSEILRMIEVGITEIKVLTSRGICVGGLNKKKCTEEMKT